MTYSSAQVKGTVDVVRDPTDAELDRVKDHLAQFVEAAGQVGADVECLMLGGLAAGSSSAQDCLASWTRRSPAGDVSPPRRRHWWAARTCLTSCRTC